jgi:hypothetical protein
MKTGASPCAPAAGVGTNAQARGGADMGILRQLADARRRAARLKSQETPAQRITFINERKE